LYAVSKSIFWSVTGSAQTAQPEQPEQPAEQPPRFRAFHIDRTAIAIQKAMAAAMIIVHRIPVFIVLCKFLSLSSFCNRLLLSL
jgi:hypothetical protein